VVIARALDRVEAGAMSNGYNITNLRFSDDIAETEKDLHSAMNHIAREGQRMGNWVWE